MWSLYKGNKLVKPLQYSNGKTQEDVVEDIIDALRHNDVIFFRGSVGSGKSAVALNVINYFGSGHIVVPTKVLEKQYRDDYMTGKFRVGDLNIHMMMGKSNYKCKYTGMSCGSRDCPCSQPLKKGEKRYDVAKECPHWSPIYNIDTASSVIKSLQREHNAIYNIKTYESIRGKHAHILSHDPCNYYKTFSAYTDTSHHVIIFNSAKWDIETWIGRKPRVPVEIIDEADAYLDGLTYKVSFSDRIFEHIKKNGLVPEQNLKDIRKEFNRILAIYKKRSEVVGTIEESPDIRAFLENFIDLMDAVSTDGMVCEMCNKVLLMLRYTRSSFVRIKRDYMTVYIPRPDITLEEIKKRSGKLVFMSATFQDIEVIRDIYGIKRPVIIEGETRYPGTLIVKRTGHEQQVNNDKWQSDNFRRLYWNILSYMLSKATRPVLVQVHSYKYVPDGIEVNVKGDDIWWSTVTDRGIDLPDDKCRSIVVLKYPFPDLSDPVLKTMKQMLGDSFWKYYRDIANRDLIQQVGRGLRHKDDWVELWSPDKQVLDYIVRIWNGNIRVDNVKK